MSSAPATTLISGSDLKRQRGWTEGLIVALLGAPDALAPNPHGYRAPMRYFAEDRVLDAERADRFTRWVARLDPHRAWRREQPTRSRRPTEIAHLEWLDNPRNIALFLAPRLPRRRRPKRSPPAGHEPATDGYEVLRLF